MAGGEWRERALEWLVSIDDANVGCLDLTVGLSIAIRLINSSMHFPLNIVNDLIIERHRFSAITLFCQQPILFLAMDPVDHHAPDLSPLSDGECSAAAPFIHGILKKCNKCGEWEVLSDLINHLQNPRPPAA